VDRVGGRCREPAQPAAGAHRADEHVHIADGGGHPDPVAQHRSAGVRRRGIDRDDADRVAAVAVGGRELVDQRRLPRTRTAGDPDHRGVAGMRVKPGDQIAVAGRAVLDPGDDSG